MATMYMHDVIIVHMIIKWHNSIGLSKSRLLTQHHQEIAK